MKIHENRRQFVSSQMAQLVFWSRDFCHVLTTLCCMCCIYDIANIYIYIYKLKFESLILFKMAPEVLPFLTNEKSKVSSSCLMVSPTWKTTVRPRPVR